MCYVCNCFAWTLDLFQRGATFCCTCFMTCVICFGLVITVTAGIAFGYHYSFAEFITHTKSDVTIYMKRGQFNSNPDIAPAPFRRMGDDDLFPLNATSEYEEEVIPKKNSEPLSKKWLKDNDAREYAVKLTKYKGDDKARIEADEPKPREQQKPQIKHMSTLPPTRRLSSIQFVIPTTTWNSGSSQIILRKFLPLQELDKDPPIKEPDRILYKDNDEYISKASETDYNEKTQPDIKIRFDDISERNQVPMTNNEEYFIEDESDNNVMYKPV